MPKTGWVEKNDESNEIFNATRTHGCTLSQAYSKYSKIFFFPLKCVPTEWIEKKDIWVGNKEVQLIYFIVTKLPSGQNPDPIVPVQIIIPRNFFKLLSRKHVVERDTYIPEGETTPRDDDIYNEKKRQTTRGQEDRFSRPKLPLQFQKNQRGIHESKHEKRPLSRGIEAGDSQLDEFLGKRHQYSYQDHPTSESENLRSLNLLNSENYSPLKLLKETTRTTYDKIKSDMALQTSRRTNQDLGTWPFRSEEEKQTKNSTLLNLLTKSKTGRLQDQPDTREQESLRDSFLRQKYTEHKSLPGLENLLAAKERLMHGQVHDRFTTSVVTEYREPKESTLQKAFSTIRSSKFKLGVDHYGSPKLHEQTTSFPPGF